MVSKANYIDKTKGLYLGFCARWGIMGIQYLVDCEAEPI